MITGTSLFLTPVLYSIYAFDTNKRSNTVGANHQSIGGNNNMEVVSVANNTTGGA